MTRFKLPRSFALMPLAAVALFSVSCAAIAAPDSPTEQYLSLRRTYPPIVGVSPGQLASSPGTYSGKTVEVEGVLSGVVRNDRGALLMLSSSQFGPLNLSMSEVPTWVQSGTRLRILAVISTASGEDGTVTIGIPDLVVVAVASASDIAAEEERFRQEAARRAERDRQQQAALRAASATINHTSATSPRRRTPIVLASRGNSGGYTLNGGASNSQFTQYLSPGARSIYPAYVNFVQRWNHHLSTKEADAIASSILVYSEHYGVDPRLVVSLIIAESDFHVGETSNKGAMGLGQLMPDEVHDMGLSNPYDPIQNIAGAVYLLRGRLDHYATGPGLSMNQIILALASYNAGMGAVKKYGGVPPYRETQNYVKKIERIYLQLCAGDNNR